MIRLYQRNISRGCYDVEYVDHDLFDQERVVIIGIRNPQQRSNRSRIFYARAVYMFYKQLEHRKNR